MDLRRNHHFEARKSIESNVNGPLAPSLRLCCEPPEVSPLTESVLDGTYACTVPVTVTLTEVGRCQVEG